MLILALTFPSVSISLTDDTDQQNKSLLKSRHTISMIQSFADLFADTEVGCKAGDMAEIDLQDSGVSVTGIMSRRGSASGDVQFVLVNNEEVSRCQLHNVIKRLVKNSRMCDKGKICLLPLPLLRKFWLLLF